MTSTVVTQLTDDELIAVGGGGDVHNLAKRVGRLLRERTHPDASHSYVGVHIRAGLPDLLLVSYPGEASSLG
jgi:hypothetical protein